MLWNDKFSCLITSSHHSPHTANLRGFHMFPANAASAHYILKLDFYSTRGQMYSSTVTVNDEVLVW